MNREDVIRMAREADIIDFRDASDDPHVAQMVEFLQRFAYLVAAAERDACLKVIDEISTDYRAGSPGRWLSDQFLDAIRARSNP